MGEATRRAMGALVGCGVGSWSAGAVNLRGLLAIACASLRAMSNFYEFQMKSITGEMIDFKRFAGKAALVVNVASR